MSDKAVVAPQPQEMSIFERLARDPSVDVVKIEKLMELQERADARQAEAAFNAAMARAQQNIAPIVKSTMNAHTKKKYADLAAVCNAILPVATVEGLSISADTIESPFPNHLRIIQTVSHSAGFSRQYHVDLPYDGKGSQGGQISMNPIQAVGSTVSYGRRYLMLMAFGASTEDDTDGNQDTHTFDPMLKAIAEADTIDKLTEAYNALNEAATEAQDRNALKQGKEAASKRKREIDIQVACEQNLEKGK